MWITTSCGKFLEMGIPDHFTFLLRNLYAGEYIMRNAGLEETLDWKKHKLDSRLLGEISITSDMRMTPPLRQKVKRNQKASR